jgi:c-di-GMP-binding flagellar brake protein YcgR
VDNGKFLTGRTAQLSNGVNVDWKDMIENSKYFKDRRKYPRVCMDLPLEYWVNYTSHARGGIVKDASETGFLIYSTENIPVRTKLKIAVLFPTDYELANLEVYAEIIWKDVHANGDQQKAGYQYGLKFIQILEEDYWKLRRLLSGRSN